MPYSDDLAHHTLPFQAHFPKRGAFEQRDASDMLAVQADRHAAEREHILLRIDLLLPGAQLRHFDDVSIWRLRLRLLGKYFFNNDLNCERFWFLFGISPDSDISKARFIEVMTKTFEGGEQAPKLWEKLWAYFDKGRGVLPVSALSGEMKKY